MPRENEIYTQTDEVDEIFSRVPYWIVRFGISLFGLIIVLFIFSTFIVKYPDTITSEITIYAENPPARLISKVNGGIRNIFVNNKEYVRKGRILIEIENSADFASINKLRLELDTLKKFVSSFSPKLFNSVKNNQGLILGEIQNSYSQLSLSIAKYINYKEVKKYENTIPILNKKLFNYENLYKHKETQLALKNRDFNLSQNKFSRDSVLFTQKMISKDEYDNSLQKLVKAQLEINNVQSDFLMLKIQIEELKKEILSVKTSNRELDEKLKSEVIAGYDNLLSQYHNWQLKYLLISPINGKVVLSDFWSENLNVKTGDNLVSVIPEETNIIHGVVKIPVSGAGKIHEGNEVNIKLSKYPHQEYGLVRGRILKLSEIPTENFYSAYIELPNSLKTNYNKKIMFSHEMQGVAEILTDDRLLIERIFEPIKYFFSN